jgi:hypothetical protein
MSVAIGAADSSYLPSRSVMAPLLVPFSTTLTPISGRPSSEESTTPGYRNLLSHCCLPKSEQQQRKQRKENNAQEMPARRMTPGVELTQ